MDLFQGEIFVFTPQGEVKQLPVGATPIDFAFSIHTEIGLHCAGARVNGRIAPLARKLKNGDTVDVIVNQKQWPNRDWLAFVKTSRARGRIRQWIRKEEFSSALQLGRDFLERELRKLRLPKAREGDQDKAAVQLGYPDFDHLQGALGRGGHRSYGRHQRTVPRPRPDATSGAVPLDPGAHRGEDSVVQPGRPHPGDGQPDGAVFTVLSAGPRGRGDRLHHRGAGESRSIGPTVPMC